jgi:hypothetical protein
VSNSCGAFQFSNRARSTSHMIMMSLIPFDRPSYFKTEPYQAISLEIQRSQYSRSARMFLRKVECLLLILRYKPRFNSSAAWLKRHKLQLPSPITYRSLNRQDPKHVQIDILTGQRPVNADGAVQVTWRSYIGPYGSTENILWLSRSS